MQAASAAGRSSPKAASRSPRLPCSVLRERIARTPGRIALVGVSPMTERAAVSLAQAGLDFTVVNRSADKAAALAARHGAAHMSLETFRREPPAVEAY